jgi:catechol 2,3-dioxygenase-like lactoylglutathione lyase family enzyme
LALNVTHNVSMLKTAKVITFIGTLDAARALAFYRDTLGLTLVEESPFAIVFDSNGIMLRVTPVPKLDPAQFTVLGWEVPDIERAVKGLAAAGVEFNRYAGMQQDKDGIWNSPGGARIAWFHDPDGNTLSLTQF